MWRTYLQSPWDDCLDPFQLGDIQWDAIRQMSNTKLGWSKTSVINVEAFYKIS